MKRIKLISLFSSTLTLTVLLTAGCGSQGTTSGKSSGPVSLEVMESQSTKLPSPDQDVVLTELNKAVGINLKLTDVMSADDYKNQLNVRLAAGNIPDLFQVDRNTMAQLADKGLLLDLKPYIDKLTQVKKFIGDDSLKKGEINGKLFAIAKSPTINYNTFWIRKDWLDKLHLNPPTTLDELINVAQAFTNNDPDGNGKKDTYGITGNSGTTNALGAFAPIFGAFGVGTPGTFYVKDGKLVNSYYDLKTKDALVYINNMIAAGVVDPDFFSNTSIQQAQQKVFQGQAGIIWIDWPNITKDDFVKQYQAANPNAQWIQIAAPKGPGGSFNGSMDIGAAPGMYAIPKSLAKSPDKLQKVFDLLNYVSSTDGSLLVQYGVKGRDYNIQGDKVVPTDLLAQEGGYFFVYQFTGRPEMQYLQTKFAPQSKYIEFAAKQTQINTLNGFITLPAGYNDADASRYANEQLVQFVTGKRPISQYDDFVKTLESQFNYKTYMDSATKQLTDLGFGK